MVIKFLRLKMLNFKGSRGERTIEFNDTVTLILGANRTGKTTIADAVQWVLFGKNSEGKSDFGIKTRDENGVVIPEIDHEVTLTLTADGREIELKRCWAEKWSKPKKQDEKVLTGHSASYFIDGNKFTETDYIAYIESLCSESLFRAITNPEYFPKLTPDKQRALLTKMVGEVNEASVADGNEEFTAMLQEMNGQKIEEYNKQLSYRKTKINEELERIPVRISEQESEITKLIPEFVNWGKIEQDITATDAAIERIIEEIADNSKTVDSDYDVKAQERAAINSLRAEVQDIEFKAQRAFTTANQEKEKAISSAKHELNSITDEIKSLNSRKGMAETALVQIEEKKKDFRKRWNETDALEFTVDESEFICPTCKRRFDDADVQKTIEKMRDTFNTNKASTLEKLQAEADSIKKQIFETEATIKSYTNKIAELEVNIPAAKEALDKAQGIVVQTVDERLSQNENYASLKDRIIKRTEELNKPVEATDEEKQAEEIARNLNSDRLTLQKKRDELKKQLDVRDIVAKKRERITELQEQEKVLNTQLSELESKEEIAKEFTKAIITELESKVNALFANVRFTMFEHKLNGALKPTCECSVGGVPYSDLNNADKINAGIDIINAICSYNNVYAPCFIDNAESINDILPMKSQAIHLIVSRDKQLTVIK
ncbi:AAA family ATPase [Bacteroides xylanisolvens]|uniref:AAA family ATPase n=1 Tax=Bacteroides xylanisolvens TaxID=371601 RepID=UPI001D077F14|nr:AAA family ATPase [Bacteroides xylanisolvens]MCB6712326.1 AAA family ATPase [Bacteroides xylanisolvens]MCB6732382.1 AAA family ATPase [Bacteroides xylanisolvens]MCB7119657.1 AAA family ATPase [Bacteroides xylanisolvens]